MPIVMMLATTKTIVGWLRSSEKTSAPIIPTTSTTTAMMRATGNFLAKDRVRTPSGETVILRRPSIAESRHTKSSPMTTAASSHRGIISAE